MAQAARPAEPTLPVTLRIGRPVLLGRLGSGLGLSPAATPLTSSVKLIRHPSASDAALTPCHLWPSTPSPASAPGAICSSGSIGSWSRVRPSLDKVPEDHGAGGQPQLNPPQPAAPPVLQQLQPVQPIQARHMPLQPLPVQPQAQQLHPQQHMQVVWVPMPVQPLQPMPVQPLQPVFAPAAAAQVAPARAAPPARGADEDGSGGARSRGSSGAAAPPPASPATAAGRQLLSEALAFQAPTGAPGRAAGRLPQPSLGSALHAVGQCNPCAHYWKDRGCTLGAQCDHCHLCPDGELRRRKKEKAAIMKAQRLGVL